jgi:hypothetical protein
MKRLLLVALGMAMLLALTSAPPAAAYDGQASATMSCTDNTSTMTRTVIVTIKWTGVQDFGVTSAYAAAVEPDNATTITQGSTLLPGEKKGTASVTLSFSDTAPFGFVPWQIYANTIAPIHAGELNAANFPSCPNP